MPPPWTDSSTTAARLGDKGAAGPYPLVVLLKIAQIKLATLIWAYRYNLLFLFFNVDSVSFSFLIFALKDADRSLILSA